MPTIVLAPTDSAHDAIELATTAAGTAGDTDTTGVTNHFGDPDTFGPRYCGIKFPLPSTGWLLNKVINSATIAFTTNATRSTVFDQRFYMEDNPVPANFVSGTANFDISLRSITTTYLDFGSTVLGAWTSGVTYSFTGDGSTDITDLIDELIANHGAGAIGSLCCIFLWQSGTGERFWRTYDHGSYPTLTLDYTDVSVSPHESDFQQVRVLRHDFVAVRA